MLVLSCADLKTTSYFTPPINNLKAYDALEIMDFETAIPNLPKRILSELPDNIENKLKNNNTHFKEVKHGEITSIDPEKTLVLLGEIKEFQSGSDIKIEGGSIKFGELSINISLAIVEKNTGAEITTGEIASFNTMSFSKGSKFYDSISNEVLKFIAQNS